MLHTSSALLFPAKPPPPPPPATHRRVPTHLHWRSLLVAASPPTISSGTAAAGIRARVRGRALRVFLTSVSATTSSGSPSSSPGRNLGFRYPGPQLGLLSLVFVMSMVIGSFLALVIVSVPVMGAMGKLSNAMKRLSRVVSEEVPGTLSSLKLSGREINELTQQLSSLRQIISGNRYHGDEDRVKKRRSKRGGDDPLIV